jgi:ribosomal protein S19
LGEKVQENIAGDKGVVKTWSRASMITQTLLDKLSLFLTIVLYHVTENMVGLN